MNRCAPHLLRALFFLAASLPLATLPASAQTTEFKPAVRSFPPAALRGEMVVVASSGITMDGKTERLSPGARIHGRNNMLIMTGALINQTLVVNYLRESAGQVHEVWILNSEEAKLKRPNTNTKASWFSFSSSTDTATTP